MVACVATRLLCAMSLLLHMFAMSRLQHPGNHRYVTGSGDIATRKPVVEKHNVLTTDVSTKHEVKIKRRCVDCFSQIVFSTNVLVDRLKENKRVVTELQARIKARPQRQNRRSLHHLYVLFPREEQFPSNQTTGSHNLSNKLNGIILPMFGRVPISAHLESAGSSVSVLSLNRRNIKADNFTTPSPARKPSSSLKNKIKTKVPSRLKENSKELQVSSRIDENNKELKVSSRFEENNKELKVSSRLDENNELKVSSKLEEKSKELKVSSRLKENSKELKVSSRIDENNKELKVSSRFEENNKELKVSSRLDENNEVKVSSKLEEKNKELKVSSRLEEDKKELLKYNSVSNGNKKYITNQGRCRYTRSLDKFERRLYNVTLTKLMQICPEDRKENGVSFVQSALFVNLALMALSLQVDALTGLEIDHNLQQYITDAEKAKAIRHIMSILPSSSDTLKFRWSAHLVKGSAVLVVNDSAAMSLGLKVHRIQGNGTAPETLADTFNKLVEKDSNDVMHNTFEEDEFHEGVRAALISVVYLRARWRSSPTLLNGSKEFYDADTPPRRTRMMRINDVMRYADLTDWAAQAIEIPYYTPGLSLMMLVPRGRSLRYLTERVTQVSLEDITSRMTSLRVAVTLPVFTLRMTLLLRNKLEAMNMTQLVDCDNTYVSDFCLSHAVQRLMFWSEAGRNAFKDDGIEWDETPQQKLVVDRPYVFFVRWHNLTLISGNFVL